MKKYILLLIILCLTSSVVLPQEKELNGRKKIEKLMQDKIRELKNGALLVRLQTKENSIAALKSLGNSDKAKQVEEKQIENNKKIIAAFRGYFKFCPVYFFASKYSENIASGNLHSVVFYNDNLIEDPSVKLTQSDFLIAEFGTLDPDTASYYDGYYYDRSGSNLEKKDAEYGASNLGIETLKIMSNKFVQLTDPFPYYVRTYESLPIERRLSKTVAKMDKKLTSYYKATEGK